MKTIKVKTLWQGKVGVNGKYLNECIKEGANLVIEHDGKKMTIKPEDLKGRVHSRSEEQFKDRFGGAPYWLYYFLWIPDPETQPSLFEE